MSDFGLMNGRQLVERNRLYHKRTIINSHISKLIHKLIIKEEVHGQIMEQNSHREASELHI